MDEIKIWRCETMGNSVEKLQPASQMDSEESLENLLEQNPEMLVPGLTLIGRQMTIDGIYDLDLLGLNRQDKLVVFELKRGVLTRQAVAQILDYCSWIDSRNEDQLLEFLSSGSAIDEVDDFESWYKNLRNQELDYSVLRPTKMLLVGLGVDERAKRMVEYLAENEMDISLLTFHGFQDGESVLLARQVEVEIKRQDTSTGRINQMEMSRRLQRKIQEYGEEFEILWNEVRESLNSTDARADTRTTGITYNYPRIEIDNSNPDNLGYQGSHSIRLEEDRRICVTFYPIAIHLCSDHFEKQKTLFNQRGAVNAPGVGDIRNERFVVLDKDDWENHKEVLKELVELIQDKWMAERNR